MNIKEILNAEKGRTAQAQKIFAAKAKEMGITAYTKEECKNLRSWFKTEVVNYDAFFLTKAGNDALCHGLKNLQKGAQAKSAKDAGKEDAPAPEIENGELQLHSRRTASGIKPLARSAQCEVWRHRLGDYRLPIGERRGNQKFPSASRRS